jgi:hypothetical protein
METIFKGMIVTGLADRVLDNRVGIRRVGANAPPLLAQPHLGKLLLASTLIFIRIALILPYLLLISVFGFVPLPSPLMLTMLGRRYTS